MHRDITETCCAARAAILKIEQLQHAVLYGAISQAAGRARIARELETLTEYMDLVIQNAATLTTPPTQHLRDADLSATVPAGRA